ncbi:MAG: tripartite tricarboxylate transporter substrate binding protein [Burkholderiales bacterium]|nr:tripartite tricarboxylate transporter substrate binding protein [Burkholderiales bacterium]
MLKPFSWRPAAMLAASCLACAFPVQAQDWKPTRPVAFVVGTAPGGALDLTARILQRIMERQGTLDVPVVIIHKPGASNGIAWSYLNERAADGHALGIGTTNLVTNPVTGTHRIGFHDVTLLSTLVDSYSVAVVKADSALKNARGMVERLRGSTAAVSLAIAPGYGSANHTAMAVSMKAAGIDLKTLRVVVYNTSAQSITGVLGGHVDVAYVLASNPPALIRSGQLRGLATTAPQRLTGVLSDIPTFRESGIEATYTSWRALIGPRGMRPEQIAFWEKAIARAVATAEWKEAVEKNFEHANYLTGKTALDFVEDKDRQFRMIWAEVGVTKKP